MLFHDWGLSRGVRWTLYWGFWTILGFVNAASAIISVARSNAATPAWEPFLWEMSSVYTVGALYPAVAYIAGRYPFTRHNWIRVAALHCLLIIPFSLLHTSGLAASRTAVYWLKDVPYRFGGDDLAQQVLYEFYEDITTYWTLVAVALAFDYYRKYRDRELQLTQAQLQNLRGQLQPHFLFNTLNMISSRMYEDPGEADRMIARLSDLLRFSLKSSEEQEVPLRVELEMLDLYLEIMRARFQDSIRVCVEVDREAQNAMVPTLLLQPIVENAFRHGIAAKTGGGCIEIRAAVSNGAVRLTVSDNGPGIEIPTERAMEKGFGLSSTARRLEQLYGNEHRLELRNRSGSAGGGLEVVIEIPSRRSR
jgi:two-component system LytT family sensor kinase